MRRKHRWLSFTVRPGWRGLACVLLAALLMGCHPVESLDAQWQDYRERLGRVLDVEWPAALPQTLEYPSRRTLAAPQPALGIDLLDWVAMLDCPLNEAIGFRNSALGKVMGPSQQWLYETRFLQWGPDCVQRLETHGERDLARRLDDILASKRKALPGVAWNALWAGPEYQALLSTRGSALPDGFQAEDGRALALALTRQAEWAAAGSAVTAEWASQLEASLQALMAYAWIGPTLRDLERATAELKALNVGIAQRLEGRPLCPSGRPTEQARILRNVLHQIFVTRIQVRLAPRQQAYQLWLTPLQANLETFEARPVSVPEFERFATRYLRTGEGGLSDDLHQALQQHARLWSQLLAACGLGVSPAA